jgi:hypothetical protein
MDSSATGRVSRRACNVLLRAVDLASSEAELADIRALACHYSTDLSQLEAAINRRLRALLHSGSPR